MPGLCCGTWDLSTMLKAIVAGQIDSILKRTVTSRIYSTYGNTFKAVFIYLFIWLCQVLVATLRLFIAACRIFSSGMWDLVPWPGIESGSLALEAHSLSCWTTRKVSHRFILCQSFFLHVWMWNVVEFRLAWCSNNFCTTTLGFSVRSFTCGNGILLSSHTL